jgi:hypothetical protein
MNEKKSPFGDLCHQYRGRLHFSEQAMGQKIEEMGYRLGDKPGSNKQPVISQFERESDLPDSGHKLHRDPPLEYVEACAGLFGLSFTEKYSLFVAALKSSKKLVIDEKVIKGAVKDSIIRVIASLILSCTEADKAITLIDEDKNQPIDKYSLDKYSEIQSAKTVLEKWSNLVKSAESIIDEINQQIPDTKNPPA